ncbi:MAG: DNA repair protein [Bradyrhizobiaceae bacterium]|nr:MAG: DNA repair protein [Bradyrhizobiaceae bacterium]
MTGARTIALARLRRSVNRLESGEEGRNLSRVALGHGDADAMLQGGLLRGAMHEVFAPEGRHSAAAAGFAAGLAHRVSKQHPLLWVRQDFIGTECGTLSMSGFSELGFDPRRVVLVRAADAETALRVAGDGLACDALGAVVMEVWGDVHALDLVASRKLTLAARASGVTALVLRTAAEPSPSTAETRWIVRAARSPPGDEISAWGSPVLDAQLVRNRHGPTGQWIMEWKCDECLFREAPAYSQPVAAAPADRPHRTTIHASRRRAG